MRKNVNEKEINENEDQRNCFALQQLRILIKSINIIFTVLRNKDVIKNMNEDKNSNKIVK